MADDLPKTALRLVDTDDGSEFAAGSIDEAGRIEAEATDPEYATFLDEFLGEINARENLLVTAPPEPGAPPFAVATERIYRANPMFLRRLTDYVRATYGIGLEFDLAAIAPEVIEPFVDTPPPPPVVETDPVVDPAAAADEAAAGEDDEDTGEDAEEADPELDAFLAGDEDEEDAPVAGEDEEIVTWGEVKPERKRPGKLMASK
jgi:hypothetical protein